VLDGAHGRVLSVLDNAQGRVVLSVLEMTLRDEYFPGWMAVWVEYCPCWMLSGSSSGVRVE
jgi:hypothetical protein